MPHFIVYWFQQQSSLRNYLISAYADDFPCEAKCQVFKTPFHTYYCIYSEKTMAPHSSTLAWQISWTGEPGGLQSMGLLGVRHD